MTKNIFYGWYIVGFGTFVVIINTSIFLIGFTAFLDPMIATFGWSVAQISLASSMRSVETGIFNPLWGKLVDSWRAKWLAVIGVFLMGLGTIVLGQANSLALLYVSYIVSGMGSSLVVSQIPNTLIARWFKKDIGKASGIVYAGTGVAGLLTPLLIRMIDIYGYQICLTYIGIGILVLGTPLSLILRDRPEDYGLLPDGGDLNLLKPNSTISRDSSMTVKQTIATPAFWMMNLAWFFHMTAASTIAAYIMPFLGSLGMKRQIAGVLTMALWSVGIPGRIGLGLLCDKLGGKYTVALSSIVTAGALFLLWSSQDNPGFMIVLLIVLLLGIGWGGAVTLKPPLLREYFGTKNFSTIFGLTVVPQVLVQVVVVPLVGRQFDITGDFRPSWLILAFAAMVAALLMLAMPRSHQPRQIKQNSLPVK
jgi:OFA family oxalate/formate antiporter-like MFS transporter